MLIQNEIIKRGSVIVSPDQLKELCKILQKHCGYLKFSATTLSKSKIDFDDMDELINYDNFKSRRLVSAEIEGYQNHTMIISIEIGNLSLFRGLFNYGITLKCDYRLRSTDAEAVLRNDINIWYKKVRSSYWLIGKFSFNGALFVPSVIITFIRWTLGMGINMRDITGDDAYAILLGLGVGAIIIPIFYFLDKYLLGNLFPAVVFLWGEEVKHFEKWQKARSNLFWGVIMTILLGLVVNYLYDTLKRI